MLALALTDILTARGGDFLGGHGGGGGGFSDLFGTVFGGGRTRQQSAARRGADIETDATISFLDSIEGVTVSLRLSSDAPCGDCNGTGCGSNPRILYEEPLQRDYDVNRSLSFPVAPLNR